MSAPLTPEPQIDIQNALSGDDCTRCSLPTESDFKQWVLTALPEAKADSELTIRIVGTEEIQTLNQQYRNQDKPTNVLSFSCTLPPEVNIPLLGDLVICAPIITKEAEQQGKKEMAHWAHMVIHGTLHLLGYDHIIEQEAIEMESMETHFLAQLGYPAPYENR